MTGGTKRDWDGEKEVGEEARVRKGIVNIGMVRMSVERSGGEEWIKRRERSGEGVNGRIRSE